MIITKRVLPRRTVLRGAGATLALPLLDAMVAPLSATARTAAKPVSRLLFLYTPNGYIEDRWVPTTTGTTFTLPSTLQPLESVRDRVTIVSGSAHRQADSFGDGNGDHPRASAVWLSGVHAYDRRAPGVDVRLGTTADQLAAQTIGKDRQLPSLEIALESPSQIACDAGDCFYLTTISWRTPTTPNPMEAHPRVVFERLFGDGGTTAQRFAQARVTRSILDSLIDEVSGLDRTLGRADRTKLHEYLESVREVERRIQGMETGRGDGSADLPERPTDIPSTFEEHLRVMSDLTVLAYRADITRVVSLLLGRELSGRTYPAIGVTEQHHNISHHRNEPERIALKAKIDLYHIQLLAQFIGRLGSIADGDGSLLDSMAVVYGGGLGEPNLHSHTNLPLLIIGGLNGGLQGGRHVALPPETPMSNVLLALLDAAGVPVERLGDSTGRVRLHA